MNTIQPAAIVYTVTLFFTVFATAVNAYTLTLGYALWRYVGQVDFGEYHRQYLARLSSVITLPHALMFLSSAALVFVRPAALRLRAALAAALLAWAVVLVSATAAGAVHSRFAREGFADAPGLRRLLAISVARTAMMLTASALLLWPLLFSMAAR